MHSWSLLRLLWAVLAVSFIRFQPWMKERFTMPLGTYPVEEANALPWNQTWKEQPEFESR